MSVIYTRAGTHLRSKVSGLVDLSELGFLKNDKSVHSFARCIMGALIVSARNYNRFVLIKCRRNSTHKNVHNLLHQSYPTGNHVLVNSMQHTTTGDHKNRARQRDTRRDNTTSHALVRGTL